MRRDVKITLAITVLKRLVEKRRLVKKSILLGIDTMQKTVPKQPEWSFFHLYLTEYGLIKRKKNDLGQILYDINYQYLVIVYGLAHEELQEILEKLEGNERS